MKGEEKKLKKYLLISLFSTLFFTSGVIAFADEEIPTTPSVAEETDIPIPIPEGSDIGEKQPIVPVDPGIGEVEVPDTTEVPVTPSSESLEGGETVPITPIDPGTTTDSSTTEQPTTPSTSEELREPSTEDLKQPAEDQSTEKIKKEKETKPKENKPTAPVKEVTVSVDSSGKITNGTSRGTSVPIVTSDVKEISHVPTPTTPLKTATGQTIVGVKDGVPLVQDAQGNLVEDQSIPVKKLPSGNIEVKTADGKTKVLPKTGEEVQAALSILGVFLTSVAGFFGYKKNKKINNLK